LGEQFEFIFSPHFKSASQPLTLGEPFTNPTVPLPADPHLLYGLVKAVAQIVDPMNAEEMQRLEAFAQRLSDEFRIFLAQECSARGVHLPMLDELLDKWRRRRRP